MRFIAHWMAFCAFVLAMPSHAAVFLAQRGVAHSGQPLVFEVAFTNETAAIVESPLVERLAARIVVGGAAQPVWLEAVPELTPPPHQIEARGFQQRRYRLALPAGVHGPVRLELSALDAATTLAWESASTVDPKPAQTKPAEATPSTPIARAPSTEPRLNVDEDPRAPPLTTHEPMYFILGSRGDASAKLQLSFKYRLFDDKSLFGRWVPPLSKVHFGYTQSSIWDIGKDSAPFRDTSYRPSLFYLEPNAWESADGAQKLSVSAGLEHESNGRAAELSRSLNVAFVRPRWRLGLSREHYVAVWPKLVYYIEKSDNSDIRRYRGYGELNLRVGDYDGYEASATLRKGTSTFGSIQLDLSYPIRQRFFANAGGYIYLQYFHGYGETLLDYNVKRRSQVRLGYGITR